VCLLVIPKKFSERVSTVSEYAKAQGLSVDTIQRAAKAILPKISSLLEGRSPGPKKEAAKDELPTLLFRAINDLLRSLLPAPITRLVFSPQKRGLIVQQVRHWQARGVALETLAHFLGLSARTLKRWVVRCDEKGGGHEVPYESRRPRSGEGEAGPDGFDLLMHR
jgi:hypothetical protein